jgi:hypothetical protein
LVEAEPGASAVKLGGEPVLVDRLQARTARVEYRKQVAPPLSTSPGLSEQRLLDESVPLVEAEPGAGASVQLGGEAVFVDRLQARTACVEYRK